MIGLNDCNPAFPQFPTHNCIPICNQFPFTLSSHAHNRQTTSNMSDLSHETAIMQGQQKQNGGAQKKMIVLFSFIKQQKDLNTLFTQILKVHICNRIIFLVTIITIALKNQCMTFQRMNAAIPVCSFSTERLYDTVNNANRFLKPLRCIQYM